MSYEIKAKSKDYEIDLQLRSDRTVIIGDSGSGKTFLFELIQRLKTNKKIAFINYHNVRSETNYELMISNIKNSEGIVFFIDQFDNIQRENNKICKAIDADRSNSFIIIGRHPEINYDVLDVCHVVIENHKITLEYDFNPEYDFSRS